jgi:hypothetical protein
VGKIGQGGGSLFCSSARRGVCTVEVLVAFFVWPRLGSSSRICTNRGVCAIVVFVAFFVWPRLQARSRSEIGCGVVILFIAECSGRGRGR